MASVHELPDDELDKLFRASAEEFDPPYNPDDWDKLRRKLDNDDRSLFVDRLIYWGLPVLLLLITGLTFLYKQNEADFSTPGKPANGPVSETRSLPTGTTKDRPAPESIRPAGPRPAVAGESGIVPAPKEETDQAGKAAAEAVGHPEKESTSTAEVVNNKTAPAAPLTGSRPEIVSTERKKVTSAEPVRPTSASPTGNSRPGNDRAVPPAVERSAEKAPTAGRRTKRPVFGTSRSGRREVHESETGRLAKSRNGRYAASAGRQPDRRSIRPASEAVVMTNGEAFPAAMGEPDESKPDRVSLVPDPVFLTARPFTEPDSLELPEPYFEAPVPPIRPAIGPAQAPGFAGPSISVRVVVMPNLNYIGTEIKGRPAKNTGVGILGEYRFMKRLTIQSGILRSVKKYTTPFEEYKIDTSHWYGSRPESVDAVCTIFDVPVNLRFDVLVNDRRRWFLTAGATSYFMKKEVYTYNYAPSVAGRYQGWKGMNSWDLLSHLNFSVGYERNLAQQGWARRLAWQVEPFLKSPRAKGVGYGNIRLLSTGVFLSLRYRL